MTVHVAVNTCIVLNAYSIYRYCFILQHDFTPCRVVIIGICYNEWCGSCGTHRPLKGCDDMDNPNVIGNKIKRLRKEKEMTQRDLSKALNVVHSTISNWEHGRRLPSVAELKRIADFFAVSLSYFEVTTQTLGQEIDEQTIDRLYQTVSVQPLGCMMTKTMFIAFAFGALCIIGCYTLSGLTALMLWLVGVFCLGWMIFLHLKRLVMVQAKNRQKVLVPIDRHVHYHHHEETGRIMALRNRLIGLSALLTLSTIGYYLGFGLLIRENGSLSLAVLVTLYGIAGIVLALHRFKTLRGPSTLHKTVGYADSCKNCHHHAVLLVFGWDLMAWVSLSFILLIEPSLRDSYLMVGLLGVVGFLHSFFSGWMFMVYNRFIRGYGLTVTDDEGASKHLT